jgi:putative thiamine transport system substrate-binding protein
MSHSSSTPASTSRRHMVQLGLVPLASGTAASVWAQTDFGAIERAARGQTVYFNAWGGSDQTNAFILWVAGEVRERFGVQLQHVKLTDTAEAVRRVRTERDAGKRSGGTVDMIWINGENFLAMKRENMLFGPFAESLPNFAWVDTQGKPTTRLDFAEPTDGLEAPWGMAQFTFFSDSARLAKPPSSMAELAAFAKANPGRVSYPRPPQFLGTTFLKQALVDAATDRSALYKPMNQEAFNRLSAPLWQYLDALHPHLWRQGKAFPATPAAMRQMVADGELWIGMTFNPNEAANEIAAKRLGANFKSWQLSGGTIGNTHFLAIPFNANAKEGAQAVINFMMSPAAQARKAALNVWGDPTVLALDKLSAADRARFTGAAVPGQVTQSAPVIPEPHGSWVEPLEREWAKRYGA